MDQLNTFDTPTVARLHRAEYGAGLLLGAGLFIAHWHDIRWLPAIGLVAYIDVIGYLPGAFAFRRSPDGRISRRYYVLYNSMHSLLSAGLVCAAWAWLVRPEWALLAVPIHLCIDRAIFGNQLKPFGVPFEPHRLDEFTRLLDSLPASHGSDRAPSRPVTIEGAPVPGRP